MTWGNIGSMWNSASFPVINGMTMHSVAASSFSSRVANKAQCHAALRSTFLFWSRTQVSLTYCQHHRQNLEQNFTMNNMWTAPWVVMQPCHQFTMIYQLLALCRRVVQNCQANICQAIGGVAIKFSFYISILRYALDSISVTCCWVIYSPWLS